MVKQCSLGALLLGVGFLAGCGGSDTGDGASAVITQDALVTDLGGSAPLDDGSVGTVEPDGSGPMSDGGAPGAPTWTPMTEGDPGRVTLHRLNRAEYDNTVRDLLGTKLEPARDFPADDYGYGYDNIADVLTMSPLLFELYEHAADTLLEEALALPVQESEVWHMEAEMAENTVGGMSGPNAWNLWSNGEVYSAFEVPADGDYVIRASALAQQAGPALAHMAFYVDGLAVAEFDVPNEPGDYGLFEMTVPLTAGIRVVGVGFTNDYYEPESGSDRNLIVDWFEVEGPLGLTLEDMLNPQREAILTCTPTDASDVTCPRDILSAFGLRAWRRPLSTKEIDGLMGLYGLVLAQGEGFEEGVRLALKAILVSHNFVYRVELDADPESPEEHALTEWELASRLSYFLWSSMPDEELLALAEAGTLSDLDELEKQVRRMIASPKAAALVDNFAGQWLYTRALEDASPDVWYFEDWSETLRESMRAEAWLTFHAFVHEDRSLLDLVGGSTSFVNDVLAEHYGMMDFYALPGTFVEMEMGGVNRGGVLRQGALLTALSNPTRTSPVRRGKWVLGHLLCSEPPPPPPGVEGISEMEVEAKSLKEILAVHREDPVCAACHDSMDPIGLGLENFDGIGAWRASDVGGPIDASGVLPGELEFDDGEGMINLVASDDRLPKCMTEQLTTYALGRGLELSDFAFVEDITAEFVARGHRFEELAVMIAQSKPFRMRRGQPVEADVGEEEAP